MNALIEEAQLKNCYLEGNLSIRELASLYNCSPSLIYRRLKKFQIVKDKQVVQERIYQTNLSKYGSVNPFGNQAVQEKARKTKRQRYEKAHPRYCVGEISDVERENEHQRGINEFLSFLGVSNGDLNIKVEYCGLSSYNEYTVKRLYYQSRSTLAAEEGVFIYHIFEHEWINPTIRKRVEWQLRNLFQKNSRKVYARACEIREVAPKEREAFLDAYHVQGNDRGGVAYGLYFNEELVALMSFGKPRFNHSYDWELLRFCCKGDVSVVGGASKLFKHFTTNHEGTIISYSNIAKTRGSLYETLGFEYNGTSAPNYVWVREGHSEDVLTRYQTQMVDEVDIMHKRGDARVWDCGNKVWVYKRAP